MSDSQRADVFFDAPAPTPAVVSDGGLDVEDTETGIESRARRS